MSSNLHATQPQRRLRLSSARLAAVYVTLFVVGVGALSAFVFIFTVRALDREVENVISAEMEGLTSNYRETRVAELVAALSVRRDSWSRSGAVYYLADPRGARLAGNLDAWPKEVRRNSRWIEFDLEAYEGQRLVDHPVRARVLALGSGYRLLVGKDIMERKRFVARLGAVMLAGIGLCALLGTLIGWAYTRLVRRRLREIATTCAFIMSGKLSQRLVVDGSHDEFDELAAAVNHMLERMEQQTNLLRTTFDSAAHDLRAPLYRTRVRIEEALQHADLAAAPRTTMEAVLPELDRLQRTLGMLLQIAQAEGASPTLLDDTVDLQTLTREIVDLYLPEAAERGIDLKNEEISEPVTIRGNRQLIAQLLVNLVENALKYVPRGGHVQIRVATDESQAAVLEVGDDGPGIPEAEQARILQPFARLDRDRNQLGSGLGLSLVAAVVRLHRGTIELLHNEPGLLMRCHFPP